MLFCGPCPASCMRVEGAVFESCDLDVVFAPQSTSTPDSLFVNSAGLVSRPVLQQSGKSSFQYQSMKNWGNLQCAAVSSSHLWQCYWSSHHDYSQQLRLAVRAEYPFVPRVITCHDDGHSRMVSLYEWHPEHSKWNTVSNCFVHGARWESMVSLSCIGVCAAVVDGVVCWFREDALPVQHSVALPEPVTGLIGWPHSSIIACFSADRKRCYLVSFTSPFACASPSRLAATPHSFCVSAQADGADWRVFYALPAPRSAHLLLFIGLDGCLPSDLNLLVLVETALSFQIILNCSDHAFSVAPVAPLVPTAPTTPMTPGGPVDGPHAAFSAVVQSSVDPASLLFAYDAFHDNLHIVSKTERKWHTFSTSTGSFSHRMDVLSASVRRILVLGRGSAMMLQSEDGLLYVFPISPSAMAASRGVNGLGSNVFRVFDMSSTFSKLIVRPPLSPMVRELVTVDPLSFDVIHATAPLLSANCSSLRKYSVQSDNGWQKLGYKGRVMGFRSASVEDGVVLEESFRSIFPFLSAQELPELPEDFQKAVLFAKVYHDPAENVFLSLFRDRLFLCCADSGYWLSVKHETDGKSIGSVNAYFLTEFLLYSKRDSVLSDIVRQYDVHAIRYPVYQFVLFLRLLCSHCLEKTTSHFHLGVLGNDSSFRKFALESALYIVLSSYLEPASMAIQYCNSIAVRTTPVLLERFVHECGEVDPFVICKVLRKIDSGMRQSACVALGLESVDELWSRLRDRLSTSSNQEQADALVAILPVLVTVSKSAESIRSCLCTIFVAKLSAPATFSSKPFEECRAQVTAWLSTHASLFERWLVDIAKEFIDMPLLAHHS
eukprot:ANDGO_00783.mRNA.1 hypothetical protein